MPALYQFQHLMSVSRHSPLQIALRITELTHILMMRTGGITSKLNEWVRDFTLDSGGMIAKLCEYKETMVQTLLIEQTRATFGHQEHYFNNQVHYVSAAWNFMHKTLGLPYRQDPFAYKDTSPIVLKDWMNSIQKTVTPERCIALMADAILSSFHAQFISNGQDSIKIQGILNKI